MFRKLYKQLHKRIRLLHNKGREPYLSLSKILGFYPDNLQIYEQALLHKSSSVETDDGKWLNNERLEFLGDGILDAAVADIVYKRYMLHIAQVADVIIGIFYRLLLLRGIGKLISGIQFAVT